MNIFAVNQIPELAAADLPDKLVVKMPTESAQIVAAAFHFNEYGEIPKSSPESIFTITAKCRTKVASNRIKSLPQPLMLRSYFRLSHKHHPAVKWLRESDHNLAWGIAHGLGLCAEYSSRYGGKLHGAWWPLKVAEYTLLDLRRVESLSELWKSATPPPKSVYDDLRTKYADDWPGTVDTYRDYVNVKSYVLKGGAWRKAKLIPSWGSQV
jgi:hypothetical protein